MTFILRRLAKETQGLQTATVRERRPLSAAQLAQRLAHVETEAAKRRAITHCVHGHEFTPENTGRKNNGTRYCKTCRDVSVREYKAFVLGQMLVDEGHEKHGTAAGYRYGCRCLPCSIAGSKAAQARTQRCLARLLAHPRDRRHGTKTGYGYGCRCDRCVRARALYRPTTARGR